VQTGLDLANLAENHNNYCALTGVGSVSGSAHFGNSTGMTLRPFSTRRSSTKRISFMMPNRLARLAPKKQDKIDNYLRRLRFLLARGRRVKDSNDQPNRNAISLSCLPKLDGRFIAAIVTQKSIISASGQGGRQTAIMAEDQPMGIVGPVIGGQSLPQCCSRPTDTAASKQGALPFRGILGGSELPSSASKSNPQLIFAHVREIVVAFASWRSG